MLAGQGTRQGAPDDLRGFHGAGRGTGPRACPALLRFRRPQDRRDHARRGCHAAGHQARGTRRRTGPGFAPLADGVFFTRDLVNEPSNVLTTTDFAKRLEGLIDHGVEVEVLEEVDLEKLGMRTASGRGAGVRESLQGRGHAMEGRRGRAARWRSSARVSSFDTGGISLKPAGGMEDMTMDMGGAGTVRGRDEGHRRAQGQGQCRGPGGPRREHARRSRAAPRRPW